MKILVFVFGFIAMTSYAGEIVSRDIICDDTKIIAETLKNKYFEMPVITGSADDAAGSIMSIWMNPQTESWSIVATKDDVSCIIGTGEKFKVIDYKKRKNV